MTDTRSFLAWMEMAYRDQLKNRAWVIQSECLKLIELNSPSRAFGLCMTFGLLLHSERVIIGAFPDCKVSNVLLLSGYLPSGLYKQLLRQQRRF